ncbi:hypothetical protein C7I84_03180 [Mesorhizobium ephedrae]|uniref:Glycosyltransferase 2-like domain-containing protein n=1 Tax=Kumtagia ephedrae TaxID=2116701 RepID=A0A2P7SSA0_9HYPH|nr:hypothetical protein C7I84_03180 [Mesorhizobium ephedrae]
MTSDQSPLPAADVVQEAAAVAPVDAAVVRGIFRMLTGDEDFASGDSGGVRNYAASVQSALLSEQFADNILRPLRAGLIVEGGDASPDPSMLERVAVVLAQGPEHHRAVHSAKNWHDAVVNCLAEPRFVDAFLPAGVADTYHAYVADALKAFAAGAGGGKVGFNGTTVEIEEHYRVIVRSDSPLPSGQLFAHLHLKWTEGELALHAPFASDADGRKTAKITVPLFWQGARTISGSLMIGPLPPRTAAADDKTEGFAPAIPIWLSWSEQDIREVQLGVERQLQRARFLANRARYAEAFDLLRQVLSAHPDLPDAQALYISLLAHSGELESAWSHLATLPEMVAGSTEIMSLTARLLLARGDLDAASRKFEALPAGEIAVGALAALAAVARQAPELQLTSRGEQPGGLVVPEWILTQLRDYFLGRSLTGISEVPLGAAPAELRPGIARLIVDSLIAGFASEAVLQRTASRFDREGLINLVDIIEQARRRQQTHTVLPILAVLAPQRINQIDLLVLAAKRLSAAGRWSDSLPFVDEAVRREPNNFEVLDLAGNVNRQLDRPEVAISSYERALAIKPNHTSLMDRLSALENGLRRRDPLRKRSSAQDLIKRYVDARRAALFRNATDRATRFAYGRALTMSGELEDAANVYEKLVTQYPDFVEARRELLRIAQLQEDHTSVLRWGETLVDSTFDEKVVVALVKALRGTGRVEEAIERLRANFDKGGIHLKREYVRSLFVVADFRQAAEVADGLLGLYPSDLELRLLAAAAHLETGDTVKAAYHAHIANHDGGMLRFPLEMPLFLYAVSRKAGDEERALRALNPMFAQFGAQAIGVDPRYGDDLFDQLVGTGIYPEGAPSPAHTFEGPLVSVVMTTYNAAAYVQTAVRSILQQSYRNIELIIVDDCSSDSTPDVLRELERRDPRVRVILKSTNDGTYVSKNTGLLQAHGQFIALQDSDDWSHPDRLARSMAVLLTRPDLVGLTTDWLRMTTDGNVVIKAGGQISHLCCISLVFRREAMEKVGFFDSVRIAADLEFIQRLGLAYGTQAIPRLRWPLLLGRARSDSLTASEEFGLTRFGFSEPRQRYHEKSKLFHSEIQRGDRPYMPFPLAARKFEADQIILPSRASAA